MTVPIPQTNNLFYFGDNHAPLVIEAMSPDVSQSFTRDRDRTAYAKGVLAQLWDSAYVDVQTARRKYFAVAAIAFTADLYVLGGSVSLVRAVTPAIEIGALVVLGRKLFKTWRADGKQYRNGDVFEPDPIAPEDKAVYRAACTQLQKRVLAPRLQR